jgi:hypothetical protein
MSRPSRNSTKTSSMSRICVGLRCFAKQRIARSVISNAYSEARECSQFESRPRRSFVETRFVLGRDAEARHPSVRPTLNHVTEMSAEQDVSSRLDTRPRQIERNRRDGTREGELPVMNAAGARTRPRYQRPVEEVEGNHIAHPPPAPQLVRDQVRVARMEQPERRVLQAGVILRRVSKSESGCERLERRLPIAERVHVWIVPEGAARMPRSALAAAYPAAVNVPVAPEMLPFPAKFGSSSQVN